jgi:hypothetical protein
LDRVDQGMSLLSLGAFLLRFRHLQCRAFRISNF